MKPLSEIVKFKVVRKRYGTINLSMTINIQTLNWRDGEEKMGKAQEKR
jgi:hypothetical protein